MQTKEKIGETIANSISIIMKRKGITKEQLLQRLGRKTSLFGKFIYDIKKGNLTLNTIVHIANALDVEVFDMISREFEKEEINLNTLIQKGINNFNHGDVIDLPVLFNFMWESLSFGQRKKIGKEVYNEVLNGKYSNLIKIHHKNSSNHAYYEII